MDVVFPVRYYECDMQRVVHNSVYLAWCDDLGDRLIKAAGAPTEGLDWDVMVKVATITWSAPARLGDEVRVSAAATRLGNASFDLTYTGTIGDRDGFEATITYVTVDMNRGTSIPVPEAFRQALESS